MEHGEIHTARRGEAENGLLFGPFFVGLVSCYFFWGIQITQSYYYYKTYRKTDGKWTKRAVALLFVLDAVQSICVSEGTWTYMVAAWGDSAGFTEIRTWGVDVLPLTDATTTSIVHAFYAHKIWSLLRYPYNYLWTVIVAFLSCGQLVVGIGACSFELAIHNNIAIVYRAKTWVCTWLMTAAATDIVISGVMFAKLSQSRTGFKATDDLITKLIRLIVETGLMTAIVQILDVILYLRWPFQAYHAVPTFICPKLYSNSILALLNSRNPPQPNTAGMQDSNENKSTELGTTSFTFRVKTSQVGSIPSEEEFKENTRVASRADP